MHAILTIEFPRICLLGSHILLGTLIGEPVLQTTTKYNALLSIMPPNCCTKIKHSLKP